MSEETRQDLSCMEQTTVASSLVSSSSPSTSLSAPSTSLSSPTSLTFTPGTQPILCSSNLIGNLSLALLPPPPSSSSSSSSTSSTAQKIESLVGSNNIGQKTVVQSSSKILSISVQPSSSSSPLALLPSSSSSRVMSTTGSSTPLILNEPTAQAKLNHDLNKLNQLVSRSSSSSSSSLSSSILVPPTNLGSMSTTMEGITSAETIQMPAGSQQSNVIVVTSCTNNNTTATNNNNIMTTQPGNMQVVQQQQQFQQAVTTGLAQQSSNCFNVQMNSEPAHAAMQQTTTMQGLLQQTVVVSDNVSVQQRVAVAHETVSQQIVHPVSTTAGQVAGIEQQQQQQQQQPQTPQQQQTASFQLHQPVGNALATPPTFQLANLGQSLIAPQNFQGLVAQPGTIFNGAQIFCTPDLSRTQQIDVPSMGCQQFLATPTNTFTGGHMVSGVPQVQLVQTGPNQFIQQQCLQQQFMFQSMPALQNNGLTIQQQQQTTQQQQQASLTNFQQQQQQAQQQVQQAIEGSTKTQTILPATSSQQPQQNLTCLPQQQQQQNTQHQNMSMIRLAVSGSYAIPQQTQQPQALSVKGLATVLPQQTSMNICNTNANSNINQKQILQKPQQSLLFGTIGMLQNQAIQQQPQQPTIYQHQRPLSLGSMGQAAQFTIGNNGALRFAHGPSFITNTGQLLSTNQTVLNLGQIQVPLMNQQLLVTPQGGGTTTLLGSQPLYIRAADAFSTQQGVVGNMQQIQPIQQVKNVANIAPQTAAVINQVTPQPRRGGDKSGGGASGSQQNGGKSSHKSSSNKLQTIAKSNSSSSTPSSSTTPVSSLNNNTQLQQQQQQQPVPFQTSTLGAPILTSNVSTPILSVVKQPQTLVSDQTPTAKIQDAVVVSRPQPAVIVVQPKQQQQQTFEEKNKVERMELDVNSASSNNNNNNAKQLQDKTTFTTSSAQVNVLAKNSSEEERNVQQMTLPIKEEDRDENRLVIVEEPINQTPLSKTSVKGTEKKTKRKRNSKPKVLTHIIEGFIIQEATEPFPVNRTPVSNQFLNSSLKSSSMDTTRSSSKLEDSSTEEEDNNNDDDEETEDESVPKRIKLNEQEQSGAKNISGNNNNNTLSATPNNNNNVQPQASSEPTVNQPPVQLIPINLSSTQPSKQQTTPSARQVLPSTPQQPTQTSQPRMSSSKAAQERSTATHLVCEFCGKVGPAEDFPCSKRFCSVTCSKKFSAHSNKFKQVSEQGHTSTGADAKQMSMMSVIKGSKRPLGQTKSHQQGMIVDRGPTTATVAASVHIPAPATPSNPNGNNSTLLTASNLQQFDPQQQQQQHLSYTMPTTAVTPNKQPQHLQNVAAPNNSSPTTKQHPSANVVSDDLAGVVCPDKPLSQWSVNDVYNFVASLPGCGTYAQEFRQQEIDGPALGLLKEDHLMTTLNVKLGPALKICNVVNSLKTD